MQANIVRIHVDLHLADNGAVQMALDLAIEVDAARPEKSSDWDLIAAKLSNHFSTPEKPVELTGRSCRERMDRVLEKYKSEESRSLIRCLHILIIYWCTSDVHQHGGRKIV